MRSVYIALAIIIVVGVLPFVVIHHITDCNNKTCSNGALSCAHITYGDYGEIVLNPCACKICKDNKSH